MAEQGRLGRGLWRGLRCRCPNCGDGRLFRSYLKVEPVCPVCGHANGVYRADDAPAYLTILLVGHLVVAPLLAFPFILSWPVWAVLLVTLPSLLGLTLLLLPRIKGAVVGFHWAQGVKGDPAAAEDAALTPPGAPPGA